MPFTTTMSDSTVLDDVRVTEELVTQYIMAYRQADVMTPLAEWRGEQRAKSIAFARYDVLAPATAELTEDEDVASSAMGDSEVIFTPAEYGNVITTTNLAVLQSGGRDAMAAMQLIAMNEAHTKNVQAIRALEGTSNVTYSNAGGEASIVAGDVISDTLVNRMYNKLARASVPKHSLTGTYVAIAHDDVIHDLRAGSAAGTWLDVNKYNNEMPVLNNEIGMYRGFRWITNNDCAINADGGAAAVDTYSTTFIGFNALGYAESQGTSIRIQGPFDKLGRFVNVGWYGVYKFGIVETSAVQKLVTSSSVGANA